MNKFARRALLVLLVAVATAGLWFFGILPRKTDADMNRVLNSNVQVSDHARQLHSTLLIADLHADSLLFGRNLLERSSTGHIDLPRLTEGNVALQMFTVVTKVPKGLNFIKNGGNTDQITLLAIGGLWPPPTYTSLRARALYQASRLASFAARSNGELVLVRDRADLEKFVQRRGSGEKVTAAMLGLEGAHALEGDVKNVDVLYNAGFRMVGLAHFFDNEFAGSAHGTNQGGLTPLGRDLVKKLEERRIILDLAHSSPQTIAEVLSISTRPLLVSHTGVRGTCDNQRNLSDQQLKAIADRGGVIGIAYFSTATCGNDAWAIARAIRHAVNIAGMDHVALGSDFDGGVSMPFDTSQLSAITNALLKAGFSDGQIRKVMGENVFRFFGENLP